MLIISPTFLTEIISSSSIKGISSIASKSFNTPEEAEAEAQRLGGTGIHSHESEDGTVIYMPFETHQEYEMRMEMMTGEDMIEAPRFKEELRSKLSKRLQQLIDSTYSNNSL